MATLSESEMQFISQLQQKMESHHITKNSIFANNTEDVKELIEQTKTFWEYIEKKHGVSLQDIASIAPDGTIIMK